MAQAKAKAASTTTPAVVAISAAVLATLIVAPSTNTDAGKLVKLTAKGDKYSPQNKVGSNGKNNGASWGIIGALLAAGPCTRGTLQAVVTAVAGHHDFVGYHFKPTCNRLAYDFSAATPATAAKLAASLKGLGITTLNNYKA